MAVAKMSPAEAWRFLQVLIGKLGSTRWQLSLARAVRSSTMSLASRQPMEAVAAIPVLLRGEGGDFLLSGLATDFAHVKPFQPVAQSLAGDVAGTFCGATGGPRSLRGQR